MTKRAGAASAAKAIRRNAEKQSARAARPPERYVVQREHPLVLASLEGNDILREGDDDFEIARGLKRRIKKGDAVLVHRDKHNHRVVTHGIAEVAEPETVGEGPTYEEFEIFKEQAGETIDALEEIVDEQISTDDDELQVSPGINIGLTG